jgi:cholinesterase
MTPQDIVSLDNGFNCGAAEAAKARQLLNIPVWRHHLANNKPEKFDGAWHGNEVKFVFGDGKTGLSKLLQPSYAAFVRDPANGLTKMGWPKYDHKGKTLIRLAPDQKIEADLVQADMYDYNCPPSQM